MSIDKLKELVKGKRVCLIGSVPPKGFNLDDYDLVVRCNRWIIYDMGRFDIWFYIGADEMVRSSWFFAQPELTKQLKLLCLYDKGAEASKCITIAGCHSLPVVRYNHQSKWLEPLIKWFDARGTTPSTGLQAAYTLCQCEPKSLHITGANLYCEEPDHVGWKKHNPIGHCYWYNKLVAEHDCLTLGPDLMKGIAFWENYAG